MTLLDDTVDQSTVPGGLEVYLRRSLDNGRRIEFEQAPAGYLTQKGEPRRVPYRAYYFGSGNKRTRLPSVTTFLNAVLPKDLTRWAEEQGILGAHEAHRQGIIGTANTGEEAVEGVRSFKLGADAARDRAATRGTSAHTLVEEYLQTGEPPNPADHPPEFHGYLRALTRWLLDNDPEPVAVEQLVADPDAGYAGRVDLRARINGALVTVDFKTSARGQVYNAAHLQLAMYERAAVWCGDPPADELRIVGFAEDGRYREMECLATAESVEAALWWYHSVKPITSGCESHNRRVRKEAA